MSVSAEEKELAQRELWRRLEQDGNAEKVALYLSSGTRFTSDLMRAINQLLSNDDYLSPNDKGE